MYIKKINCDKFAGINNITDLQLKKNLNVITGENESGKSTLVEFIYHILFTPHDIGFNKSEGIAFADTCFPMKADGGDGSTIEGSLNFEVDGEEYELQKTWSKKDKQFGSCKLKKPNDIEYAEEAEKTVRSLLRFGAGTYRETIFSSQRDGKRLVEILLSGKDNLENDNTRDVVSDFSRALANAALEAGVSSDTLLNKLDNELKPYTLGWNIEKDEPKGKAVTDKRAILRPLFEEWKGVKDEMEGVEEAENDYERIKKEMLSIEEERVRLEEDLKRCRKFSALKKEKEEIEKKIHDITEDLRKKQTALGKWPDCIDKLEKASEYEGRLADAEIVSRYKEVKALKDKYKEEDKSLKAMKKVEKSDIDCLEDLQRKIAEEKVKLAGMNIDLDILEIDKNSVHLSYYDGEDIEAGANNSIAANRALKVEVSDKLKMQIRPRNIDISEVTENIEKARRDFDTKCRELSRETIEGIKDLKEQYDGQEKAAREAKDAYNKALERYHITWPALEEEKKGITSDQEREAVMVHVRALLKDSAHSENELGKFISDLKADIKRYEEDYQSVEKLESRIQKQSDELIALEGRLGEIDIPEDIETLDEEAIERQLEEIKKEIEAVRNGELNDARLKLVDKKPLATYRSEIAEKDRDLENAKKEGRRWNEIKKRLEEVKAEASQMDVTSLQENFTSYLRLLTSDRVTVDELSSTLELRVSSNDNLLNEKILSNGTRETIELAFRLAMLDELFPDGGGFAVFDDPLVNMDPDRTRKACKLLKEFAKRNQVIFMTCDPKYNGLFGVENDEAIKMN